jgi:hydroxymethylglutaryl-CoA reductase (NADPH)
MGPIRTLDECIDIFENGPTGRSLCDSLALLNEEIILLSQNGKLAAYALEKVLGPAELERAVRIRRALICRFFFLFSFYLDFKTSDYLLQLALHVLKL